MATAKKVPAKKATNRRKPVAKAAPATKRVVRRRKATVEEAKVAEPASVSTAAETLKQDTLTDNDVGAVQEPEQINALFAADVVDLRDVNMIGRFSILLELQLAGYIFEGHSSQDATDVVDLYCALVPAIKLQHRNKLMFPIYTFSSVGLEDLITKPVASSISAMVIMTEPDVAPPKEICLGGTVYSKTSN